MPLYEYQCDACGAQAELLVSHRETPSCPSCGTERLTKQLSVTAKPSSSAPSSSAPVAGCGSCGDPRGPGACRFDN